MADTSSYSIEERLVASVWVNERQHTGQTMSQVMSAFRERFNKAPPRRTTLLDRNVVFWSKENPNFTQELKHNPPHVMIWVGMTSDYLIGPYFFDGPVNAASYSAM